MNKSLLISMFLSFFMFTSLVSALPIIQNIDVQPKSLWLGENTVISLNCYDDLNNTIDEVYASIMGPGITLPTMYFTYYNGSYTLLVDKIYLDRTGQFDATVYCKNNNSEVSSDYINFTVSELTGYINGISQNPVYIGDIVEIDFIVKKNDAVLYSDVNFNVTLNGQLKSLKGLPAYDMTKGWILKIDAPETTGTYDLKVIAFYDRANASDTDSVEIKKSIEFEIVSIDKSWINVNDNITVTLKALKRGSFIELNKNNLDIQIGSTHAEITVISQSGDLSVAKIIAPNIASGKHQLNAYLNYEGSSYSDSEPIAYIVSITGRLIDENDKGMGAQLRFIQNGIVKLALTTDAYGYYSGYLPPDTYDIEIVFQKSRIYLRGSVVNSFNDPIKHFYSSDFDVPGITNAGLFDYEIAIAYSTADIEMSYNEKNVLNENDLRVFKCSNWNTGRKICNDDWIEVSSDVDIVRNQAKVNSTTLSALLVGTIKSLIVDFSLDKDNYNIKDLIKVRGLVKDVDGKTVSNASITANIENTQTSSSITTDNNGIFSLEIPTPKEGNYTLILKVKKNPYRIFTGEKDFEVSKSESISINFPDTLRIAKGEKFTQQYSLSNNGQADLHNLNISLDGISQDYYSFNHNLGELKSGEEKTFYIDFFVPIDAKEGISSVTLKLSSDGLYYEKVFGLNIYEKTIENKTTTLPTTGLVSGVTLPELDFNSIMFIVLFAALCFSLAFILKKIKTRGSKRDDIKKFLSDVESYIKKTDISSSVIVIPKKIAGIYDDIILSEFPKQKNKLR